MNKLLKFLIIATFIPPFLFTCTQQGIGGDTVGKSFTYPMLQPGEKIEEMVLTTGVEDAFPLSSICLPTKENDHSIRADCREVSVRANLAIGPTFGVMDLIPQSMDWEELIWEMSVDGHPIDLKAFGVYDFVHPDLAPSPSPIREVFRVLRVWDVVLVNPTPGTHRLQGQAQSRDGVATYTWVVNFTVATP
jgi:hypothetical protein